MFNFIDISFFIPVSGCVGRDPSVLFCPGALWCCSDCPTYHKGSGEQVSAFIIKPNYFWF